VQGWPQVKKQEDTRGQPLDSGSLDAEPPDAILEPVEVCDLSSLFSVVRVSWFRCHLENSLKSQVAVGGYINRDAYRKGGFSGPWVASRPRHLSDDRHLRLRLRDRILEAGDVPTARCFPLPPQNFTERNRTQRVRQITTSSVRNTKGMRNINVRITSPVFIYSKRLLPRSTNAKPRELSLVRSQRAARSNGCPPGFSLGVKIVAQRPHLGTDSARGHLRPWRT
jgi:hypothetical protein